MSPVPLYDDEEEYLEWLENEIWDELTDVVHFDDKIIETYNRIQLHGKKEKDTKRR